MTLVILALAGCAFIAWGIETAIDNAPIVDADASHLDLLDGAIR